MAIEFTRSGSATGFITPTGQEVLTNKDIDGGTATDLSRLTIPKDTYANLLLLTRKEGTVVYATDLDKLFSDDGTNLVELGSGAGGLANYMTNPNFETSISEGVTPSTIDTAAEIANPLFGDQSLKVTSQANVGYVDFALNTIDEAIENGGILLGVSGYFQVGSGASEADGDYKVGIHDGTSYVSGTDIDLKAGEINIHRTTFVPASGTTYTYRLEFTDTTISKVCDVDNLGITYQSSTAIQALEQRTVWVDESVCSITPDHGGSVQSANFQFSVDANGEYFVDFSFEVTGATSDATHAVTLGLGGVNFSAVTALSQAASVDGTGFVGGGTAIANQNTTSTVTQIALAGKAKLTGKPSYFDDHLDTSKVNLITPSLLVSNDKAKWNPTDTAYTANTPIDFDTLDPLYPSVGNWSMSNGTLTIHATGYYEVNTYIRNTVNFSASQELFLYVNGAQRDIIDTVPISSSVGALRGAAKFYASKDDTIHIRANGNATLAAAVTFLEVTRIADIGAHEPVGFAQATETQSGLVTKIKYDYRELTGTYDTNAEVLTDFNNLDSTKRYRLTLSGGVAVTPNSGSAMAINASGIGNIAFLILTSPNQQASTLSAMAEFTGLTSTSITVGNGGGGNGYWEGSNVPIVAILEELDSQYAPITSDWD